MNKKLIRLVSGFCISAFAITANAASYDVSFFGGSTSGALAINSSGVIAGFIGSDAAFWNGSSVTILQGLGGSASVANSINDAGQIAGRSNLFGDTSYHATLWNGSSVTDLGTLGGANSSASGINSNGMVVGTAQDSGGYVATVWNGSSATGLPNSLFSSGTSSFGVSGNAVDINDSGQIVGSIRGGLWSHGTAWKDGRWTDNLETIPVTMPYFDIPPEFYSSAALGINNSGIVVGTIRYPSYGFPSYVTHASLWSGLSVPEPGFFPAGASTVIDLGALPGDNFSQASGVNNHDVVVGYSGELLGNPHATLWSDSTITDLNSLLDPIVLAQGWVLTQANAINDNGLIIGQARNSLTGDYESFLLTPVPEAETYSMLLVGFGLLKLISRRREQKSSARKTNS